MIRSNINKISLMSNASAAITDDDTSIPTHSMIAIIITLVIFVFLLGLFYHTVTHTHKVITNEEEKRSLQKMSDVRSPLN